MSQDPALTALKDIRDALRETNLRLTDIYHMVRLNCRETKRLDSRLSRRIPLNKVAKCKK